VARVARTTSGSTTTSNRASLRASEAARRLEVGGGGPRRRAVAIAVVIAVAAIAVGAAARPVAADEALTAEEERAREESRELFKQGKNAFRAGDYDAARELFQRAWARWDREPLIALALAKAYDRASLIEKAVIYYEHFLRLAPATKDYVQDRELAVARLGQIKDALAARPGILRFKGLPSGAALTVDGKPADVDSAGDLKVAAGTHTVKVTMDKRLPFERAAVSVGPGEVKTIEVVMVAPVDPATLPRDHRWTWRTGASAGAAFVAAGVFGALWFTEYGTYADRFDPATGQPNERTRTEYGVTVKGADGKEKIEPCQIGEKDAAGKYQCQAAADEGNVRRADIASWQRATLIAGGAAALFGVATYAAWLTAPPAESGAANTAIQWRIAPTAYGAALHLAF